MSVYRSYFYQNSYSQGVTKKILILVNQTDFIFSEERISKLSSYKNTWEGNYSESTESIKLHCLKLVSEDMHDAIGSIDEEMRNTYDEVDDFYNVIKLNINQVEIQMKDESPVLDLLSPSSLKAFSINHLFGFKTINGFEVIPPIYDIVLPFQYTVTWVCRKTKLPNSIPFNQNKIYQTEKWILINMLGENILSQYFYEKSSFSEGYTWARNISSNEWMLINENGEIVTKLNSTIVQVKSFNEGLAAIACMSANNQLLWGFCNTNGEIIILPTFDNVLPFNNGEAIVTKNNMTFNINTHGKEI